MRNLLNRYRYRLTDYDSVLAYSLRGVATRESIERFSLASLL